MNSTIFTVYWMYRRLTPNALQFYDMTKALSFMETLRKDAEKNSYSGITMCSENANQVGRMGVDEVIGGRTPDGEVYDWNKSSRIGRVKGSARYSVPPVGTDNVVVPVDDDEWMSIGLNKSNDE